MMIYGKFGREPLMQVAGAIGLLFPDETPLADRLPVAREVAVLAREHVLAGTKFMNTAEVNDVEFVDRVLNVNETSYDVAAVMDLLAAADLTFLRWIEPADWDPTQVMHDGALRQRLLRLPVVEQWRFLEMMLCPAGLEFVIAKQGNALRDSLTPAEVPGAKLRLSPEVVVSTGVRHSPAGIRTEDLSVKIRGRQPIPIAAGPLAAGMMLLKDSPGPWRGDKLLRDLGRQNLDATTAVAVVMELLKHEILVPLN
jgi:hypothetical protein